MISLFWRHNFTVNCVVGRLWKIADSWQNCSSHASKEPPTPTLLLLRWSFAGGCMHCYLPLTSGAPPSAGSSDPCCRWKRKDVTTSTGCGKNTISGRKYHGCASTLAPRCTHPPLQQCFRNSPQIYEFHLNKQLHPTPSSEAMEETKRIPLSLTRVIYLIYTGNN
jgi:hypothetical protein